MKFTGERVIPGQGDSDLFNEHRARYLFAQRYACGKNVLDAACGSGYGSALLAETARSVTGIDIAAEAVEYSRSHYGSDRTRFARADGLALPFQSGQFEAVVAFEIIEHLPDAAPFLAELRRVLVPSGLLILSTPNRLYYTEDRGEVNPFHQREFSFGEFRNLLHEHFSYHEILFQNHVSGLLVADHASQVSSGALVTEAGAATKLEEDARAAHFFVALCCDQAIPASEPLLYLPSAGNLLREREEHIRSLQQHLDQARSDLSKVQAEWKERTEWAQTIEKTLAQKESELLSLQAEFQSKAEWAADLDRRLAEKDAYLLQLQVDYEEKALWAVNLEAQLQQTHQALRQLQLEFDERTAWALRLDRDLQSLLASRWYRVGQRLKLNPVLPSHASGSNSGNSSGTP